MFSYVIAQERDYIEIWGTFSDLKYLSEVVRSAHSNPIHNQTENEFLKNFSTQLRLGISSQEKTLIEYGAPPSIPCTNPLDKSNHHQYHIYRVMVNPIELALCMAYLIPIAESDYTNYLEIGFICLLNHILMTAYQEYAFSSIHIIEIAKEVITKKPYQTIRERYLNVLKRFEKLSEKKRYEQFESIFSDLGK